MSETDGYSETRQLREVLKDILFLAVSCRHDMQGRLSDDEHRRAFAVLGSIAQRAERMVGPAVT